MRLITYQLDHKIRLGILLDKQVIDVQLACKEYYRAAGKPSSSERQPDSLLAWLVAGEEVRQEASEAVGFISLAPVQREFIERNVRLDLKEITLLAPRRAPER